MMISNIHWLNVLAMAELSVAEHLFSITLKKRDHFAARLSCSVALCLIYSFLFPIADVNSSTAYVGWGALMYVSFFFLSGIALLFCYEEDIWAILFCTVAGQSLQNMGSNIRSVGDYLLALTDLSVPAAAIYLASVPTTYIACILIFYQKLKKNPEIKLSNIPLLILAGAAIFIELILALVIRVISSGNMQPAYLFLIHIYAAVACIFILYIEFDLVANRTLETEIKYMDHLMKEREKQHRLAEENIQLINMKCHDLKHQIHRIQKEGAIIDRDALTEIESAVNIYDAAVHTGNSALDIILTEKSLIAEKEGIQLTCMVEGEKLDFIAPADIYALFGNAIDNAQEAVMQLADHEQRNISINVRGTKDMLVIRIENYFNGTLVFENGLPKTTKDDKNFHGFGMKSMEMVAKKYGGYLAAGEEGNVFYLNILIPLNRPAVTLKWT